MRRSLKITLITIMVLLTFLISSIYGVGYWMMPVDVPVQADAIIVVSGGGDERLDKGIELFNEGYSDIIVFSGDAIDPDSPSNAEVMRDIAISYGIPKDSILIDPDSKTTNENAKNVKSILEKNGINPKVLILVTSSKFQESI